ncbi:GrdX protein [Synergistales bacterium]|nr:GrdX protein [Synergistales bacterium]
MRSEVILVTNNTELYSSVSDQKFTVNQKIKGLRLVEGTSLDVLKAVRGAVHLGARLLTHPLCGNLRPYQQPFRSVLIEERVEERETPCEHFDMDSVSMIESAVTIYQDCCDRIVKPQDLCEAVRKDYAFVDSELMRESLARYGVFLSDSMF